MCQIYDFTVIEYSSVLPQFLNEAYFHSEGFHGRSTAKDFGSK